MATLVIAGSTDRLLRLAAQITAAAHESEGTVTLTLETLTLRLDNGVTGSIAATIGPVREAQG